MGLGMKRTAKRSGARRWTSVVLATVVMGLPVAGATGSSLAELWLRHCMSDEPVAFKHVDTSSEGMPVSGSPAGKEARRREYSRDPERKAPDASLAGLARDLLHHPGTFTLPGSRLDYCSEYTKPDSLKIRLMGTPKNHRSPPA